MKFCISPCLTAATAGILLILSSCQSPNKKAASDREGAPPQRRLNVVLVTIDTLRPDRLGCYGYSKSESPDLDSLAKSGVLFETAVTQTPLTTP